VVCRDSLDVVGASYRFSFLFTVRLILSSRCPSVLERKLALLVIYNVLPQRGPSDTHNAYVYGCQRQ
jgi:hypothetical protein